MNTVILKGNATADAQVVGKKDETLSPEEQEARKVVRYSLAINENYKKDGEKAVTFVPCVAFGKTASFAEKYVKKGTPLLVTGKIKTGEYTNKEGQKVRTMDVQVLNHEFAGPKPEERSAPATSGAMDDEFIPIDDNELPFS